MEVVVAVVVEEEEEEVVAVAEEESIAADDAERWNSYAGLTEEGLREEGVAREMGLRRREGCSQRFAEEVEPRQLALHS